MLTEPLPVDIFVSNKFEEKFISKEIEGLRIESVAIQKVVISHLKEMGIYSVTPESEKTVKIMIIDILNSSPILAKMKIEANCAEEARRQRRRFSD